VTRLFTLKFESRDAAVQFLEKVRDLRQYRLELVSERSLEVWRRPKREWSLSSLLELL
jgi:hypothetical protein